MTVAILAYTASFGSLTSLLVRNESSGEEHVIRKDEAWQSRSDWGRLGLMAHHSAVAKYDFQYVIPPEFDDYGNVKNALQVDNLQVRAAAEYLQWRLTQGTLSKITSEDLEEDLSVTLASSDRELIAARQRPKSYDRHVPKKAKKKKVADGPKKKS